MQTLFVTRRTEQDELGTPRSFDYFVLVDEVNAGDTFCCESYGVRIAEADDTGHEAASVRHITTNMQRIDELMELLVRQFVTPATLQDVVADWL